MPDDFNSRKGTRTPIVVSGLVALILVVIALAVSLTAPSPRSARAGAVVEVAAEKIIGPTTCTAAPCNQLPSSFAPTLSPSRASVAYGTDPAQVLSVYLPHGRQTGTILYFHSGGWAGGTRTDIAPAIEYQLTRGWAIVSADYRLAPSVRAAGVMGDANQALRYVHANAKGLGLTTKTLVVAGESAGGHRAALLGLYPTISINPNQPATQQNASTKIDGVVDQVGPPDMQTFWKGSAWMQNVEETFLGCVVNRATIWASSTDLPDCTVAQEQHFSPAVWAQVCAAYHVSAPPVFMAYGGADPFVPPAVGTQQFGSLWAQIAPGKTWFDFEPASSHLTSYYLDINRMDRWFDHIAGVNGAPQW